MTENEICAFTEHTVVCGYNEHALQVITELEAAGRNVALISHTRPARLPESVFFVEGDPNDEKALARAGIMQAASAVILAENALKLSPDVVDSHTVLTTLAVESQNPSAYTVVEILNPANAIHARRAHVDDIIFCDKVLAEIAASSAGQKGLAAVWDDLLCSSDTGSSLRVEEVSSQWEGKRIAELFAAYPAEGKLPLGYIRMSGDQLSHKVNPNDSEIITLPMSVVFIASNV